jgi:hypothetical protein
MNAALRSTDTALHIILEALRMRFIDAAGAGASPRFSLKLNRPEDLTARRVAPPAGGPRLR